jgi:hypothetical protein
VTDTKTRTTKPMTAPKAIAAINKLRERRQEAVHKTTATYDEKEDTILANLTAEERARVLAFFGPISTAPIANADGEE